MFLVYSEVFELILLNMSFNYFDMFQNRNRIFLEEAKKVWETLKEDGFGYDNDEA